MVCLNVGVCVSDRDSVGRGGGGQTCVGSRNHILNVVALTSPANTMDLSMCGGDAAYVRLLWPLSDVVFTW